MAWLLDAQYTMGNPLSIICHAHHSISACLVRCETEGLQRKFMSFSVLIYTKSKDIVVKNIFHILNLQHRLRATDTCGQLYYTSQ